MKREIAGGMAGAALLAGGMLLFRGERASAQLAGPEAKPRTVTAQGTATVTAQPDSARLFFQIVTSASTVAEARSRNAVQMAKVRTALTGLRIPELKTKSSDLDINPIYVGGSPTAAPKLSGFKVIHTFTVRMKHQMEHSGPEKLSEWAGKVLDTATNAGVNSVQGVSFFLEDDREVRRKALELAVTDALDNARALARGAARNVTGPIEIQGTPGYGFEQSQMLNTAQVARGGGEGSSLVAGDLQVTCNATVVCGF